MADDGGDGKGNGVTDAAANARTDATNTADH